MYFNKQTAHFGLVEPIFIAICNEVLKEEYNNLDIRNRTNQKKNHQKGKNKTKQKLALKAALCAYFGLFGKREKKKRS